MRWTGCNSVSATRQNTDGYGESINLEKGTPAASSIALLLHDLLGLDVNSRVGFVPVLPLAGFARSGWRLGRVKRLVGGERCRMRGQEVPGRGGVVLARGGEERHASLILRLMEAKEILLFVGSFTWVDLGNR